MNHPARLCRRRDKEQRLHRGDQKGGVCKAKYPKSWIVNIAAQTISIPIKARVLNWITPPQRARSVVPGEALMRRLPLF